MRNDWETPPTVEGLIVRAWIGEDEEMAIGTFQSGNFVSTIEPFRQQNPPQHDYRRRAYPQ
ncbi:TPA: hypothetical protein I9Y23_005257 [Kluyvera ascorbata]|uniref:Uncharacterized protein n=1 Tax=Kluyvera genomosp. 2 TaxID=2774054 RepID=A0A2T2XVJ8_9ENTR|nr:hypothetical protein [Kluyvera genomosp. 2]HAT3921133.1 hypothetical protein [Kluyvera ascorbata]PSR44267.1 hypothetical protein C8256_24200 [Kluyvera genomosp. 2]QMV80972.1 hypothetical protein DFBNBOFD_00007 [Kluyvera genomosp. 2]QPL19289.1 hypothetical protein LHAHJIBD_00007 [Kluyvera genomosp. 2]HAT3921515.1 hypothetical protein [Kluyvera ascorbata]